MKNRLITALFVLPLALALHAPLASATPLELQWTLEPHRVAAKTSPPTARMAPGPVTLAIDDGVAEGDFGVNGATARQFLWFNQLTPPEPMILEEIHVLFPAAAATLGSGDPIDLVVYLDSDGDPTTGAELLAVYPEIIQVADGATFSVYPIELDEVLESSDDVYLGVIPRFIESGITAVTSPAALDTTEPQGRSWVATWQGDPPQMPSLPSDGLVIDVDSLIPGNWTVRGFGSPAPVVAIPVASTTGLLTMALLILVAGLTTVRSPRLRSPTS